MIRAVVILLSMLMYKLSLSPLFIKLIGARDFGME
jgi:hypothetical protein